MNDEMKQMIIKFDQECTELMFGKKDHDYNNKKSTIDVMDYYPYGWQSVYTLINKHLTRLRALYESGEEPANETLENNWKDLANYIRLGFAVMETLKSDTTVTRVEPPNV